MQQDKGRPLPKFGDWDMNNPASAEGFTVIFNKARDEKRTTGTSGPVVSPRRNNNSYKKKMRPINQGRGGFVVGEPTMPSEDLEQCNLL
ncbi:unnamed protein product [Camellia sinensis]